MPQRCYCHDSDDGRTDTRPPLLVTASVDAIDLKRRLRVDKDMIMAGEVTTRLPKPPCWPNMVQSDLF